MPRNIDHQSGRGRTGVERGRTSSERGQTTIDFAIGASVFLLTVAFILLFVPGMFDPFTGAQENPLVADRVASQLAQDTLGDPSTPSRLNETCTLAFFKNSSGTGCPFDTTETLNRQIGISSQYEVSVTLRRDLSGGPAAEVLCYDSDSVLYADDCSDKDKTKAMRGPPVPDGSSSVITARRTVYLDGRDVRLAVMVW